MNLVCNAGPVMALAKLDRLALLGELFPAIQLPETVFHELLAKPDTAASRILEATRSYLHVVPGMIRPEARDPPLLRSLDAGERAVLALAGTFKPSATALLDDAAGRRVARKLGVPVIGLVGLLLLAKRRHLIDRIIPELTAVRAHGYWLSDELIETARHLADER